MSTIEVMVACAMACELEDPWLQEFGWLAFASTHAWDSYTALKDVLQGEFP